MLCKAILQIFQLWLAATYGVILTQWFSSSVPFPLRMWRGPAGPLKGMSTASASRCHHVGSPVCTPEYSVINSHRANTRIHTNNLSCTNLSYSVHMMRMQWKLVEIPVGTWVHHVYIRTVLRTLYIHGACAYGVELVDPNFEGIETSQPLCSRSMAL